MDKIAYYKNQIEKTAKLNKGFSVSYSRDKTYRGDNTRINITNKGNNIAYAVIRPDPAKRKNTIALSEIYVNPNFRGQGIASHLLEMVKNDNKNNDIILRANPYKDKSANVDILKKIYESHGFKPYGQNSDLMIKTAKLKSDVNLYPYQQKVVESKKDSTIIAHPVGSGKTLTSIAKFEKMKELGKATKALVIVPASLRDNFAEQGIQKFTNSTYNIIGTKQENKSGTKYKAPSAESDYNIISYEMFKKDPEFYIKSSGADTVIMDEAHRQKNEDTQLLKAIQQARPLYKNHISLTGSLISNSVSDIQPLIDIVSGGKNKLGKNKDEFMDKWTKRSKNSKYKGVAKNRIPITGFKNKEQLRKQLLDNVDYLGMEDIKSTANMPKKNLFVKKVSLSPEQAKFYKKLLKNNPEIRKLIFNKRLETLKDKESAAAFSKLIEARKLMNNMASVKPGITLEEGAKKSPKLNTLLNDLTEHLNNNPKGRALIFSHLINGGVDSLEVDLKRRNIQYGKFIGKGNIGVTEETRQHDVTDYNKGKKRVMLISSAGGEGLSLGDTTWEGVLDPHYNPEKMNQMEARGIRSGGQSYLPEQKRQVNVNRYISTMPKFLGLFKSNTKTPDEFIYEISKNKGTQNKMFYDMIQGKDMKAINKMDKVNKSFKV